MGQTATAVNGGAATPFAAALVGVRYVGQKPTKRDTLLYRRREWRRGEVIRVPPGDAAAYLKHPMVWRSELDPWDERQPVRVLTQEELGRAIRERDRELLERCEPVLAARLWPDREVDLLALVLGGHWKAIREQVPDAFNAAVAFFGAHATEQSQAPNMPLAAEDAGRLIVHVGGLAQALVQGTAESAFIKLDMARSLLEAYPPLVEACIEAERQGKNRSNVDKRLQSLAMDMLDSIEDADGPQIEDAAGAVLQDGQQDVAPEFAEANLETAEPFDKKQAAPGDAPASA